MTALIRNLATMTRVGLLDAGLAATAEAVAQLGDAERIRQARVHPIAVLAALRTTRRGAARAAGNGGRPVRRIVDALDAAFYTAFGNVDADGQADAAGARRVGLDGAGWVAGIPGLSPRGTRRRRWRW